MKKRIAKFFKSLFNWEPNKPTVPTCYKYGGSCRFECGGKNGGLCRESY